MAGGGQVTRQTEKFSDSEQGAGHAQGGGGHHHKLHIPALLGQVSRPLRESIPLWQEHILAPGSPEIVSWRACALFCGHSAWHPAWFPICSSCFFHQDTVLHASKTSQLPSRQHRTRKSRTARLGKHLRPIPEMLLFSLKLHLCVLIHAYIHMHTHVHMHVYAHTYIVTCLHMHTHVHMHDCFSRHIAVDIGMSHLLVGKS